MSDDELVPGPYVRRKLLGRQLRELREQAGVLQGDAAKYAGLKPPSISRMESGKQAITARSVRLLCQRYDVGAPLSDMLIRQAEESSDKAWYSMYSDTVPSWVESFLGLESEATEVWTYEAELVPGLLQTPDYVRQVAAQAKLDGDDLQRRIELRIARQQRLLGASSPSLHAVLNEAVVRRPVGDMVEQIGHLLAMGSRDKITVQILPFSLGPHVAMTGSFTMLRFPDELQMNATFLEHDHGATSAERPADIDRYGAMFERLVTQALSPEDTRAVLTTLVDEYDRENKERSPA